MDVKQTRTHLIRLTIILFIVYLFAGCYFFIVLQNTNYIGLRAEKVQSDWKIKRIQSESSGEKTRLKTGDFIVKIDQKNVADNKLLNQWLIVENASEITIVQNGKEINVDFPTSRGLITKYILPAVFGILGFIFLLHFIQGQNGGKLGRDFYNFIILMLFLLIAIIPSSMGNFLGRLIVLTALSLCPYYLLKFLSHNKKKRLYCGEKKSSLILLGIAILNIGLCILSEFIVMPYVISEYLAQGVFYVIGFVVVFIFAERLTIKQGRDNRSGSRIDLALVNLVGFAPLMLLYIFPVKWEAPFLIVVPFIIFPVIAIFHTLIVSKLISYRYQLTNRKIYILITCMLLVIVSDGLLLNQYIPAMLVIGYIGLLIYIMLPFIEEMLTLVNRQTTHVNSIALFSAVESERENISTYIHDTVIQDIIYTIKRIDNNEITSKDEILEALDETVFYLRELCSDIYPLMIQEVGLKQTILAIIQQLQKKHPVIISCTIDVQEFDFGVQKNNFILRSLREFMNNSILHGNATEIEIFITEKEKFCLFEIVDNGIFLEANKSGKKHFGLDVIKEKLIALSGELHINFNEKTTVEMKIPLVEKGENKNEDSIDR
ncbi:MAG: hypothetical protein ACRCV7_05455 [Culicoidibacterales bacterium]